MSNDTNSLAHTKWNWKYHIVFAPKYRRKVFYGEMKAEIGKILRELCSWKQVEIIEAEICPDHVPMLVKIPPKMTVSSFMGFLKGKSSIIIHERHGNLKYKHGNRSFWCGGYYVDTAGKNAKKIQEYIQNQLKEDQISDQMTLKEYQTTHETKNSMSSTRCSTNPPDLELFLCHLTTKFNHLFYAKLKSALTGHSDISVTANIYNHISESAIADAAKKINEHAK